MSHIIIEIKARCDEPVRVREILKANGAQFKGVDHQIDTYFRCATGRLKLRQGDIENNLIHYHRPNTAGPKQSDVTLLETVPEPKLSDVALLITSPESKQSLVTLSKNAPESNLRELLSAALGVLVVVDKQREIYFIDNVKFHIDTVAGLGSFVEIEAIDYATDADPAGLDCQCRQYITLLGIQPDDLVECSYCDMLLAAESES